MKNHMANGFTHDLTVSSVQLRKESGAPIGGRVAGIAMAVFFLLAAALASVPAKAQQANQPGYDPRQTEKRFEDLQSGQGAARPRLPMPKLSRPEGQADSKPLFVLRHVAVTGAMAIPRDRLATAWQPYLGKKVSQADLGAIATAVGDIYRAAGFHLSRAIIPPQDIQDGRVQLRVVEGGITEVVLKGEGAEQVGIRPMLDAVVAEQPSHFATLERQLLLINGRPGVRIDDTALEEIGTATGCFRLTVYLKTWHFFTSFCVDNLGSSAVGPWQGYPTARFNSYLAAGDSLVLNLA